MGESRRRRIAAADGGPLIIVPKFDAGERDLSFFEVQAKARKLLGKRASIGIRRGCPRCQERLIHVTHTQTFEVAAFADERWLAEAPQREQILLGRGASFMEAFANAERAVANGRVSHLSFVPEDGAMPT